MSDPKDLNKYPYPNSGFVPFEFNVKKIDEFVNSTNEHTDNRKDRNALTWFGIEEANRRAREALNYKKVEYVAGNVIDGLLQYIIAPDGNAYQIKPTVSLPFEIGKLWVTDSGFLNQSLWSRSAGVSFSNSGSSDPSINAAVFPSIQTGYASLSSLEQIEIPSNNQLTLSCFVRGLNIDSFADIEIYSFYFNDDGTSAGSGIFPSDRFQVSGGVFKKYERTVTISPNPSYPNRKYARFGWRVIGKLSNNTQVFLEKPSITSLDWGSDKDNFFLMGDIPLRSQLSSTMGTSLIGMPVSGTLADALFYVTPEMFAGGLKEALESVSENLGVVLLSKNMTINIPTDCPDIQTALNKTYTSNQAIGITLNIRAGHQPKAGIKFSYIKRGNYRIVSEDEIVKVSPETLPDDVFMECGYSDAPVWGIKLDMDGKGNRGIHTICSTIQITPSNGVINCFGKDENSAGIYAASGSTVSAPYTKFTGNGRNLHITTVSRADFTGSDCSNAINIGAYVSRGSTLNCSDTKFSNANSGSNSVGLYVLRSWVSAPNGLVTNNCRIGVYSVAGSMVSCHGGTSTGNSFAGYYADGGSIAAASSTAGAPTNAYRVERGGYIAKDGGTGSVSQTENRVTSRGIIYDSEVGSQWVVSGAGFPVPVDSFDSLDRLGFYTNRTVETIGAPTNNLSWAHIFIPISSGSSVSLSMRTGSSQIAYRRESGSIKQPHAFLYHTQNTTIDSNGFLKAASPVVNVYHDRAEPNEDDLVSDVVFTKHGVGHYEITGVPELAREGWYLDTPKDRNGNIYFFIDYFETETGVVIKTYEPDYSEGRVGRGVPVDIKDGRFVSLRFHSDEPSSDECAKELESFYENIDRDGIAPPENADDWIDPKIQYLNDDGKQFFM